MIQPITTRLLKPVCFSLGFNQGPQSQVQNHGNQALGGEWTPPLCRVRCCAIIGEHTLPIYEGSVGKIVFEGG
jgi:hypothetical protein